LLNYTANKEISLNERKDCVNGDNSSGSDRAFRNTIGLFKGDCHIEILPMTIYEL